MQLLQLLQQLAGASVPCMQSLGTAMQSLVFQPLAECLQTHTEDPTHQDRDTLLHTNRQWQPSWDPPWTLSPNSSPFEAEHLKGGVNVSQIIPSWLQKEYFKVFLYYKGELTEQELGPISRGEAWEEEAEPCRPEAFSGYPKVTP